MKKHKKSAEKKAVKINEQLGGGKKEKLRQG